MKLRRPCEHGNYDGHVPSDYREPKWCNGGEFLPEDALIIEKVKCGTCGGKGKVQISDWANPNCPTCQGSGKLYPPELVELIAFALARHHGIERPNQNLLTTRFIADAVVVLDALGESE